MPGDERDPIDSLLAEALPGYSGQEPPAGLEQRILNRVRTARVESRFGFRRWALAVPVLACVLLAIVFSNVRISRTGPIAPRNLVPAPPQLPRIVRQAPLRKPVVAARRHPAKQVFPSPAPMTAEERRLLTFIRQAPDLARLVLSAEPPLSEQPIGTNPAHIQELQVDDLTR